MYLKTMLEMDFNPFFLSQKERKLEGDLISLNWK